MKPWDSKWVPVLLLSGYASVIAGMLSMASGHDSAGLALVWLGILLLWIEFRFFSPPMY